MYRIIREILKNGIKTEPAPNPDPSLRVSGLKEEACVLEKSLSVRHVDAGSCNGCELEIHALNNPYYSLEGSGLQFVASPRHADMLLVTGPVSKHMEEALKRTYEAMPEPKLVVALGDCGRNGGIFCSKRNYACSGGVSSVIPVDVEVPGCPPEPEAILRGILSAIRS
ncbi:MAG TPA: NADH-quinone oxidoreductase subunit NuoB [Burkholderiales bacterium]|nr:NADH-quinone oxidoreductase subunit NuoB [Burkholderiales bacterium]